MPQLDDVLADLYIDVDRISRRLADSTIKHNQELCDLNDELQGLRRRIELLRMTTEKIRA